MSAPTMPRTSDAYTSAVMLTPDGAARRVTVLRVRLDTAAEARAKLAVGKVAWVRVEDTEATFLPLGDGQNVA